jgi:hypothetical protein
MEFKGTKGKWHFDKKNAKVYKEDGNVLCICYHTNIINKEESEPNALLISKAPEMLEMLNWFANEFEDVFHEGTETNDMVLKANQLIKEATKIQ